MKGIYKHLAAAHAVDAISEWTIEHHTCRTDILLKTCCFNIPADMNSVIYCDLC